MKTHIAKCGYRCDLCPAFGAELTDADKADFSRAFKQYFDTEVPPEAIRPCSGCQSSDIPNDKECPVFPCVQEKGFQTCAECDDFGCNKLKQRMDIVEQIAENKKPIPPEDFEKYFKPFLSRQTMMEIRKHSTDETGK
jgi:hypothetical protein